MIGFVRLSIPVIAAALIAMVPTAAVAAPAAQPTMGPMPGMDMGPMPMGPMPPASPSPTASISPAAKPTPSAQDMRSVTDLADPMSQAGSGTSWEPKSTQMFGWMRMGSRDMQMTHGAIFPRYVSTGSLRGDRRADAPNWFMFMGTHALSDRSQFGYATMFSADFLTENENGYPLLFQTGESAYGMQLHDHQHPHDLFAELAGTYSARVGSESSVYAYVGYPGEPALGPPAFMHRRIGYDMPDTSIGHHWQDATHIQFGVATLGFAASSKVKVEASAFTGREPNEIRTNFDPLHLDSYSARLSWSPSDNLATEVSYAFIKSPEALDPVTDQYRLIASLLYNKPLGLDHNFYAALVFGQNTESSGGRTSSYLFETDYQSGRNTGYARVELGTRSARDLVIPLVAPNTVFSVGAYTFGAVHDLTHSPAAVDIGLGAQFTVGSKSAGLNAVYGSGTPLGYEVFFRIRPPDMAHTMRAMAGMSGMQM